MKTRLIFFIATLISLSSFRIAVMQWEKVTKAELKTAFEQSSTWFTKNHDYQVKINFLTYKDHITTVVHEKQSGYFARSGSTFKSNLFGILTIQNKDLRVTIDTLEQIIVLNNRSETIDSPVEIGSFGRILDAAKALQKMQKEETSIYKIEFNPNALYDSYEFEVDKKGLIRTIKYFFSTPKSEIESSSPDLASEQGSTKSKPRAEILFSDYQTHVLLNEKELSLNQYFQLSGKKIILTSRYRKYEVKDLRYAQNK